MVRSRRPLSPEWLTVYDDIRSRSAKYGDHLLRIESIEMYEGLDDKSADLIIACKIIEHLPDPGKALDEINKLARKAVIITVEMTHKREEQKWKDLIGKHINISAWERSGRFITASCMPGMRVNGIKPVGALTDDIRWQQVLASIKRVDKRIELSPAHGRRALIGCYGPSLRQTYTKLCQEAAQGGDVISVSGAHDFLIQHGIIPDYHIECDPRPHKAENIRQPHEAVQYLISSNCHPAVFDKLEGYNIRLWHVAITEHCVKLVDELGEKSDWIVSGGGSVGLRSISLLYAMGYRDFSIYGMDCSFSDDQQQWAGPHAGKAQSVCVTKCGSRDFVSSPVLLTYAGSFFDIAGRLPDVEFHLYGDGLLQSMAQLFQGKQEAA